MKEREGWGYELMVCRVGRGGRKGGVKWGIEGARKKSRQGSERRWTLEEEVVRDEDPNAFLAIPPAASGGSDQVGHGMAIGAVRWSVVVVICSSQCRKVVR